MEISKPKFPETNNPELRSLYLVRKPLEESISQREERGKSGALSQDEQDGNQGSIAAETRSLKEINARITALEKLEKTK